MFLCHAVAHFTTLVVNVVRPCCCYTVELPCPNIQSSNFCQRSCIGGPRRSQCLLINVICDSSALLLGKLLVNVSLYLTKLLPFLSFSFSNCFHGVLLGQHHIWLNKPASYSVKLAALATMGVHYSL